jgi:hypothetical protein
MPGDADVEPTGSAVVIFLALRDLGFTQAVGQDGAFPGALAGDINDGPAGAVAGGFNGGNIGHGSAPDGFGTMAGSLLWIGLWIAKARPLVW